MSSRSLKWKKNKSPKFAAGCSREVIERGANLLGWELNDLIPRTIAALKFLGYSLFLFRADFFNFTLF